MKGVWRVERREAGRGRGQGRDTAAGICAHICSLAYDLSCSLVDSPLTPLPSPTEGELGLVIFTDGVGEIEHGCPFGEECQIQKQLLDVLSYSQGRGWAQVLPRAPKFSPLPCCCNRRQEGFALCHHRGLPNRTPGLNRDLHRLVGEASKP